ncbi:N-acetylmuramoyl-L-alanine amidase [Flavonifractor plautii]|uniref:N-acetylmuramoyl-L-alanine amidase n=1 Tax=Flavonifractor plautii TaxID=292800 RepID=UPI00214BCAD3|nr:N-acetylmuramoyl-L-alanine amidase [Flavonifractor plautii]MCR1921949.1 N-acetylmuramoyl-L-alanine amidase [Flavonifractor plautii]
MSKYKIAAYPQAQYRFRLYDNARELDWPEIQRETGAYALVNLGFFSLSTYEHQCAIMVGGKWAHPVRWHEYGMLIDKDGRLTLGTEDQAVCDYIIGCPTVDVEGRRYNTSAGGCNGWTYTGLKADGTVVALLCPKDTPMETEKLDKVMRDAGCVTIWRWDGSWSSRGTLGPGLDVTPSQYRECRSWLLIHKREGGAEEPPDKEESMGKYTVTPSIGVNIRSGPGTGYGKAGAYPCGAVVDVLEARDGWGRTDKGWVSLAYLEAVEGPQRATDNGIAIQEHIISDGRKNRPGRDTNPDTYITIHETGNAAKGADAAAHGAYLDSAAGEDDLVSWHYTVDDHAIVQHLPGYETAYHAGDGKDGPGNTTSIGVEICVNAGGDFEAAKANAASLVRLLMEEHGIPIDHVMQHNHWNGKDCPKTIRATTGGWEAFLALCRGKAADVSKLDTDVDTLAEAGIINSPDYWRAGDYSAANVQALIGKMADYVREDE